MPKPRINVLTVKLTTHIPVDLKDAETVVYAAKCAEGLLAHCKAHGWLASMPEPQVSRVSAPEPAQEAPEPAPPDDDLDIPPGLDRRAETEPAAAE